MLTLILLSIKAGYAEKETYTFGVLNQRSILLTAQYWNPILRYVSDKSGVRLELKLAKTAPASSILTGQGEFDFIYSNLIFLPANEAAGYRVIARPMAGAIRGQIVTLANSRIQTLEQLQGKTVGFPSTAAFVGYALPMNALLQARVTVTPVFAGNQEGIMAQLKAGRIIAAGVNSELMSDYAERENFKYRVLWESESYLNLPIAVLPSVPSEKMKAVRAAFVSMTNDPAGYKILADSASIVKQDPPYGFIYADDRDYENYRKFYKSNLIKGLQ